MITGPYTDNRTDASIQQDTLGYGSDHIVKTIVTNAVSSSFFTGSSFGTSGFIPLGTVADAYVSFTDGTSLSCDDLISGNFYPIAIQFASCSSANASIIITARNA